MALTDSGNGNGSMVMPVAPMGYGYGYPTGGFGGNGGFGFGGDWAWILLLFLLGGNGWGGFGGFGGMLPMMMGGAMGADMGFGLYPWLNNSEHISDGFRDQQLSNQISGLRSDVTGGFADTALGIAGVNQNVSNAAAGIQNSLCNGFAGINLGMSNGFAGTSAEINGAQNALAQQLYSNELASLNRSFAEQTANTQGFNGVQAQIASCCCDQRLGTESLRATVLQENCQDRYEAVNNTRDIIDSQTRGTQAILDKLCALELDGVKAQLAQAQRENVGLQNQLNMATFQASQVDQTAQLRANQATVANQLVSELRSCPIPSQPVYGNQPIFTCNNGGCSGNAGFVG